jgi:hypothetical protein
MLILTFLSLLLAQILLTHGSNNKEAIGRRSDDLRANSPADIKPAPAEDQFEFDNIPDPADKNQQQQQKIHEHQQSLLRRNKRQLGTPLEETISVSLLRLFVRKYFLVTRGGEEQERSGLTTSSEFLLL